MKSTKWKKSDADLPEIDGKYSVLLSVYKKECPEYLKKSLESMLHQTLEADEIILVEDGELTEQLYGAIDTLKKQYPDKIRTVKLAKNSGLGNALNEGIKYCKNEIIIRMDTDDISLPDRCEKQIQKFIKHPELSIVGGQIDEFIDQPEHIVSSRIVPFKQEEIKKFSRRRSPFNHPAVAYRKSQVIRAGGYGKTKRKEDLELFVTMINLGCQTENLEDTVLLFRTGKEYITRKKTWQNCRDYIAVIYSFYKKGYSTFFDLTVVIVEQLLIFLMPARFVDYIVKKYLRKKKGTAGYENKRYYSLL